MMLLGHQIKKGTITMLCLLKPIHWNPKGYTSPAGHQATGGYPKQHGYGHEEWNNSPKMRVELDGVPVRVLHTEPVGQKGMLAPNDTLLMMYASHNGRQQLVGVAGNARCVKEETKLLSIINKTVGTKKLWREAWSVPLVQKIYPDEESFREHWNDQGSLSPNWICPEQAFFWLDEPVDIDALAITGKSKLVARFNSFTTIPAERAAYLLDSIPTAQRNDAWRTIRELLQVESAAEDIFKLRNQKQLDETTRKALIDARLGQGKFRADLLRLWQHRCALTGCGIEEVLRASHICPWRDSDNEARLDPDNGLLLAAHVDALFDRYLISFNDNGDLLISTALPAKELLALGLTTTMRIGLRHGQQKYIAKHRQEYELRNQLNDVE